MSILTNIVRYILSPTYRQQVQEGEGLTALRNELSFGADRQVL